MLETNAYFEGLPNSYFTEGIAKFQKPAIQRKQSIDLFFEGAIIVQRLFPPRVK